MLRRPQIPVEEFETAALPYLPELYRTARFMLRNGAEAEDLVQEAYLEAWKSFYRFKPGTNCRAWLFSILFHCLHHLRRRQLKTLLEDRFETNADADRFPASAPREAEIRDQDILQALGRLRLEYREVVLLADVEEFSYKEIADTLQLPLGTVMSRLSRGRSILRQELSAVAVQHGIGRGEDAGSEGTSK